MNGLHDVVVALQWVQRNVHYFGGDPTRGVCTLSMATGYVSSPLGCIVTLAGQSSGSYLSCTLSVSPLAKGLFKRCVVGRLYVRGGETLLCTVCVVGRPCSMLSLTGVWCGRVVMQSGPCIQGPPGAIRVRVSRPTRCN